MPSWGGGPPPQAMAEQHSKTVMKHRVKKLQTFEYLQQKKQSTIFPTSMQSHLGSMQPYEIEHSFLCSLLLVDSGQQGNVIVKCIQSRSLTVMSGFRMMRHTL